MFLVNLAIELDMFALAIDNISSVPQKVVDYSLKNSGLAKIRVN